MAFKTTYENISYSQIMITVTKPSLPPLKEFTSYLEEIWDKQWITNCGDFHKYFEEALAEYLGVKYVSLFCNGTIALLVGIKALRLKGEIITTPFTFVASAHAIKWSGCTPIFSDIESDTFNLNPRKIESLVTDNTAGILPVHIYGNPCNVNLFKEIADKHHLKLFYDAAHSFGVKKNGDSILVHGDLSMLSFHATKTFNTIEGGALVTNDLGMKKRIDYLKNFAFENEETVVGLGINGKMNELQAAYGLLQLKYIDEQIDKCRELAHFYRNNLSEIPGIIFLNYASDVTQNYSYFPILVNEELFACNRDQLYTHLKKHNIATRKYFYPIVSEFDEYKNLPTTDNRKLPIAKRLSSQVLCLPLYSQLSLKEVSLVVSLIRDKI